MVGERADGRAEKHRVKDGGAGGRRVKKW
jgi:hypothetical protein